MSSQEDLTEEPDTLIDAVEFARRRGISPEMVGELVPQHRLFSLERDGRTLYPAFFTHSTADIWRLEAVCRRLGTLPGGSKWQSFVTPKGSLAGERHWLRCVTVTWPPSTSRRTVSRNGSPFSAKQLSVPSCRPAVVRQLKTEAVCKRGLADLTLVPRRRLRWDCGAGALDEKAGEPLYALISAINLVAPRILIARRRL